MIRKLKKCNTCGKMSYLFSHGRCEPCTKGDYAKKQMAKLKPIIKGNNNFYLQAWESFKKDKYGMVHCLNCDEPLEFDKGNIHHILPKRKGIGGYPQFAHDLRNVIPLGMFCCHHLVESAISYPKMRIYSYCETIKKELLGTWDKIPLKIRKAVTPLTKDEMIIDDKTKL